MSARGPRLALVGLLAAGIGCGSRLAEEPKSEPVDAAPSSDASSIDSGDDADADGCPVGTTSCSGACVDTDHHPEHCGACDEACGDGEVCHEGACRVACPPELTACGGSCHDLRWDPGHCGACGHSCDPGLVCSDGVCGLSCVGGATRCGDACVDLDHDPAHCGACGVACATGGNCIEGACACPATAPDVCGATCVDTTTDPMHCGACGKPCLNGRCATVSIPDGSVAGTPLLIANDCVKALDVAVSPSHACARVRIGALEDVWCWGDNATNQLGREFIAADAVPAPVVRHDGPWALGATSGLAVGSKSTHVMVGAIAWFWGSVDGGYRVTRAAPWASAKSTGVGSLGAGWEHVCWTPAPRGVVRCEGNNYYGQLGRGEPPAPTTEVIAPLDWPGGGSFRAWKVAAIQHTTCALADDGTEVRRVYCWGRGNGGRRPFLESDRDATDIVVGAKHKYLRDKITGAWACWGSNDMGQCGLDVVVHGTTIASPTDMTWTSPSLSAGVDFNCGLNGGKVFCWGTNANGELGDGTEVAWSAAPREVFGITGAVNVSTTDRGACAVKDDGTIWCWGRQEKGRFGKIADGVYRTPTRVNF